VVHGQWEVLDFLKKSEFDSEFHRILRNDLENATEVRKAFSPRENLLFPGPTLKKMIRLLRAWQGRMFALGTSWPG
jgi:hypothetical protein